MHDFPDVNTHIVLVDDEPSELDAYSFLLQSMGFRKITTVSDSRKLMPVIESGQPSVVFLDLNMPHKPGKAVLAELREIHPQIPVVICTANADIEMAVECLKLGAHDYLVKPINAETFGSALRNALEISSLRNEVMSLKGIAVHRSIKHPEHFASIITGNPRMIGLFHYIESIAASTQPVLILGETGTGKELFARAVHDAGACRGAFVAVDVSGLDDPLFSDTLFGHRKGAYTGADRDRTGLIESAAGGTLFLDEIGDLNKASQVKLLRLLQEGVYYPLGDDRPRKTTARLIAATNKPLGSLAGANDAFRVDLYYRLSTHLIQIPPLRDRTDDIERLVHALVEQAAASMDKRVAMIRPSLIDRLAALPFPGNVRELKTYAFDAVAQCRGAELGEQHIAHRLDLVRGNVDAPASPEREAALEDLFGRFPTLAELTEYAIDKALAASGNNQSEAARALGISKQALNKRLQKRRIRQS